MNSKFQAKILSANSSATFLKILACVGSLQTSDIGIVWHDRQVFIFILF